MTCGNSVSMKIPFNKPYATGHELEYINEAVQNSRLSMGGQFTEKCCNWLQERFGSPSVLLTHSCTAALEMAALLLEIGPGDEVIMPSFTFPSTANAFALRGATPVFVDILADTLCMDTGLVEAAITPRTRALAPVHYAGVACHMDALAAISEKHGVPIVEDAAHALFASYHAKPLGSFGAFAALSFHETKNLTSGEGGALLVNDVKYVERAEIILEKGTNRRNFYKGLVDKYRWVDIGSSYGPSELNAAFLWAQMQESEEIQNDRQKTWQLYHSELAPLEDAGYIRRPVIPDGCTHNAHLYYILVDSETTQKELIATMHNQQIYAISHYVPLHDSPAGKKFGRCGSDMDVTISHSQRVIRLPLWIGEQPSAVSRVVESIRQFFKR